MKLFYNIFTHNKFNLIIGTLVFLNAILAISSISNSWYTTADDAISATIPVSRLKDHVITDVILTGRVTHLVSDVLFWIPHAINSFTWYKAFAVIPVLLNFIFIPLLLLRHGFPKSLGLLCFICGLLFFQNDKHHAQATSFVFAYTTSYIIGTIAVERYLQYLKSRNKLHLFFSIFLLLSASYVYESNLVVFYGMVFGIGFFQAQEVKSKVKIFIRSQLTTIAALVTLYIIPYVSFRKYYPSQYSGSMLAQDFDLLTIWKTLYAFSSGAFIFSNFKSAWHGFSWQALISNESQLVNSVPLLGVVYSIFNASCFYLFFRLLIREQYQIKWTQIGCMIFIITWLFLSPNIPISVTPQYQKWAANGSKIHAGTYLSGFGLAICTGSVLWILGNKVRHYKNFLVGISSICVFILSALTYAANHTISLKQSVDTARWSALSDLRDASDNLSTSMLASGQLWYAPDLWRSSFWGLQHPFPDGKDYWSNYFEANKTKVKVIGQGGKKEWEDYKKNCGSLCEQASFIRFFPLQQHNYVFLFGRNFTIYEWINEQEFVGLSDRIYVTWNLSEARDEVQLILPKECYENKQTKHLSYDSFILSQDKSQKPMEVMPSRGCRFILSDARLGRDR